MGFTDLLSRFQLGKAFPPSHYDQEFRVASVDNFQKSLSNRDKFNSVNVIFVARPSVAVNSNTLLNSNIPSGQKSSSNVMGQNTSKSSLANFKLKIIVAILSCIAQSKKICDNSHIRGENCTSKCLPIEKAKFNFRFFFSDKVLLHFI